MKTKVKMKKLLSVGMNRKLGRKIGVFNLPQGVTCPWKTALCGRICYAGKAERCYPSARGKRQENFDRAKKDDFAAEMKKEIQDRKLTMVRIHESGDFFNQEYLDKWVEIIAACPETLFLCYTKSFPLDWTVALELPNFSILWSVDKTTTAAVPAKEGRYAVLVPRDDFPPENAETCYTGKLKANYCGTTCIKCWIKTNRTNIYFDQH